MQLYRNLEIVATAAFPDFTGCRPALKGYHESGARTRSFVRCPQRTVPFRSAAGPARRVGNRGWRLTVSWQHDERILSRLSRRCSNGACTTMLAVRPAVG